jgi:hypothetical protein
MGPDSYSYMWIDTRRSTRLLARALPVAATIGALLALPLLSSADPTPSAPAPAPKPPLAYTGYVPDVSETTATLRGGVIPRGTETSYSFQYGTTVAYGSQTPSLLAGAGGQEVKVSQPLTGLIPNTVYHFRLVAVSAAGTATGPDHTFTTKKTPLKIAILAPHNPGLYGDRITVSGTVSGSDAANHWIVLQANPYPYLAGFRAMSVPEVTDAAGNFSFPLEGLKRSSQLRVATVDQPKVLSPVLTELLAVRVSFHARHAAHRGYMHMYGSVAPAQAGARVDFQWLRRGHMPAIVSSTVLRGGSHSSRFSALVRLRHKGLYRAYVRVTSGELLSHYSRAVRIR